MNHNQRQSVLNSVDGNTLNCWNEEGEQIQDNFLCELCCNIVPEKWWAEKSKCCKDCLLKEY